MTYLKFSLQNLYQIGGNIKGHVNPIWYGLFFTALCNGVKYDPPPSALMIQRCY